MTNREAIDDIVLVTEAAEAILNQRQLMDYRNHREKLIRWMVNLGKDPDRAEGYAWDTARQRAYRLDKFYRWVWEQEDGYTLSITTDHADEYSKHLAYQDHSATHKATIQKAIKTLFKFQRFEHGTDVEWEPVVNFTDTSGTHQPRDFLTREERRRLKEAALEYGSIPNYNSLTPAERDRWKIHLAQRFEKPKSEVTKADWEQANGWKYPSIVWVSMDAGFRPKEVGRAKLNWLDLENAMLRIPKGDSTKNEGNWNVALSDRTAEILSNWVVEREQYDKYEGSDAVWLTKYANPYGSEALNRLLRTLCEVAELDIGQRDVTWYSIRHSVGTYMAQDNGLAAAQAQLRHRSESTTMRYDQAPVEDRKETLDNWD